MNQENIEPTTYLLRNDEGLDVKFDGHYIATFQVKNRGDNVVKAAVYKTVEDIIIVQEQILSLDLAAYIDEPDRPHKVCILNTSLAFTDRYKYGPETKAMCKLLNIPTFEEIP